MKWIKNVRGHVVRFPVILVVLSGLLMSNLSTDDHTLLVQSTTSTANSGLYDYLLPLFTAEHGIEVHVVAVGTGQAIKNARNCDGDVLLVHAKAAEAQFVADGFGVERFDLMANDFVFVGPADDPAQLSSAPDIDTVMRRLMQGDQKVVSRGDDSGTHKKERQLWAAAGLSPDAYSGQWYREVGAGMGAALNVAIGMDAYVMTDRATWVSFTNKGSHRIVFEGDPALSNQYGVIAVNPERCPSVNAADSVVFVDWLLSDQGQKAIASFTVAGQALFVPNAIPSN